MWLDKDAVSKQYVHMCKTVLSCFVFMLIMLAIGRFNKYIFAELNVIYLYIIVFWFAGIVMLYRIPKGIFFPGITFSVIFFIFYMYLRLYNQGIPSSIPTLSNVETNGVLDISLQLVYYGLFLLSAMLYYKKGFSTMIWFLVIAYIIAFIARNSIPYQWEALKTGHNISPGICIFTLVPFVFFKKFKRASKMRFTPHIFFLLCTLWVLLVRARGPAISLLIFYGCIIIWPVICKNKRIFLSFFFISLLIIFSAYIFYIYSMKEGQQLQTLDIVTMSLFNKSIDTRYRIWSELWVYIKNRPILGYGTNNASALFAAPKWYWQRVNLASNSTYFELMLRLGVIGLLLYLSILASIWNLFWQGRKEWIVRVAGSFLISLLFFMTTGEYLIFNLPLRSGFGWIILGIGAGAALKVKNNDLFKIGK